MFKKKKIYLFIFCKFIFLKFFFFIICILNNEKYTYNNLNIEITFYSSRFYISKDSIDSSINKYFFKRNIKNLKYKNNLEIKNIWPNNIYIKLYENDILGFWNNNFIINSKGDVFEKSFVNEKLPYFYCKIKINQSLLIKYNLLSRKLSESNVIIDKLIVKSNDELYIYISGNIRIEINYKLKKFSNSNISLKEKGFIFNNQLEKSIYTLSKVLIKICKKELFNINLKSFNIF